MRARFLPVFFVAIICCLPQAAGAQDTAAPAGFSVSPLEPFTAQDRVLVLAPHPDDEAIGCAGVIQGALKAGAQVRIALLTNGDHNELAFIVYEKRLVFLQKQFIRMGEIRRRESLAAMQYLGVPADSLEFLGYPDFGTFTIFRQHWKDARPFKSWLTRISRVPYKENLSPGALYMGENVLKDLEGEILRYKPTKIFVSHPADVNVDHKSLYLFLRVALADLSAQFPAPKVYPYLIHSVGWPLPRHYHPELALEMDKKFLTAPIAWSRYDLSPEEVEKKYRAILFYKSQTTSSAFYLLSFARQNEWFGDFADIELFPAGVRKAEDIVADRPKSLLDKARKFFGFSELFPPRNVQAPSKEVEQSIEVKGVVSYALDDEALLIRVQKNEEINKLFGMQVFLFGYKKGTSFAAMPKIRIVTKYNSVEVFDGRSSLATAGVEMELTPQQVVLKVPLKILGDPNFILTSLKTFQGLTPADALSFRTIVIKGE